MDERNKLLRSIARTERKLARMRARLEDEMRTKEEIEADIVQVETQAASARHNASDWQKTAKACEESLSRLRAELAALPPEPVRLRAVGIGLRIGIYADDGVCSVADVMAVACARHKIDANALADHILAFGQPAPNAKALAAADTMAEAVAFTNGYFGAGIQQALTAYRKAREVRA